jgi:hypothetical protein
MTPPVPFPVLKLSAEPFTVPLSATVNTCPAPMVNVPLIVNVEPEGTVQVFAPAVNVRAQLKVTPGLPDCILMQLALAAPIVSVLPLAIDSGPVMMVSN